MADDKELLAFVVGQVLKPRIGALAGDAYLSGVFADVAAAIELLVVEPRREDDPAVLALAKLCTCHELTLEHLRCARTGAPWPMLHGVSERTGKEVEEDGKASDV